MADSAKRVATSKDATFQDRCSYYMYEKASVVFADASPDPDDLLLSQALWAGQVNVVDMARIVTTNPAIGITIDAGDDPLESDIEYVIMSGTSFNELATSYKAAGLIGA